MMAGKRHLLAPGPTPVPEAARLAMARELIHHRGPAFKAVFEEVQSGLGWSFETDADVLSLTCSGTGAFEAAMINFTRRDSTIVAIGGGKFGERWAEVGRAYGMKVVEVAVPWGESVSPDVLAEVLKTTPEVAMVTVSASETSTGAWHPVEAVARVVREHSQALFAVDGITAVGVQPIPMDAWNIDVLVSGSQKAFGVPPGLAFVAANERAWERYAESDHPRYYFDLGRERDAQQRQQTAFTPAISVVLALQEALKLMREEGREALFARHQRNARAARAGVEALGLRLFAEHPANSVTAALVPDEVSAKAVVRQMRDTYGVTIAGGQGDYADRLVRIGHIGFFEGSDMLVAMSALERALADQGLDVDFGRGVGAAQRVLSA
ncbi:alanine--glyoxylate aminotransferase family protein [Lujinxingia vulgaris]|uniref:Alanine--glyoxylate aminotransferase family protein n=2 Tax=Lujinxingia vulgaris TaxID=2600176 RepID=A0A5C6XNH4_9DELT|nr:alanine--glyoxylate aminotransferase family protein [Lujinxingia vulgaris]